MAERRRAVIPVPQRIFEELIQLPPGFTIVGVRDDWTRNGVLVLVEGEQLAPVPDEVETPRLFGGTWRYEDGRMYWTPPPEVRGG